MKGTSAPSAFVRRILVLAVCITSIAILLAFHFTKYDQTVKEHTLALVADTQTQVVHTATDRLDKTWNFERDSRRLTFSRAECDQHFPKLYFHLESAVQVRNGSRISSDEIGAVTPANGYIRAMIYDEQLYIINTGTPSYTRGLAALHAIHRAIVSSPEPLPNIEFTLSVADQSSSSTHWALTRRRSDELTWLMPDFAYWSWPETKVGAYHEVQDNAIRMENSVDNPTSKAWTWGHKIPQLFYRGATLGITMREKLMRITKDKAWANVKSLNWASKGSMTSDLKTMDEHCQYKYLINTDGRSYSGRLKFLQNCRSVILMHKSDWLTHHTHLMQESGPDQNYVKIETDLDDLEDQILALQQHDAEAQRIADNNVRIFRERYLTPAAEVCYWRRLFHSWSEVSFEPELFESVNGMRKQRGVSFESYALMQKLEWDPS